MVAGQLPNLASSNYTQGWHGGLKAPMTAFEVSRPSNPTNHPRRPEFDLDAIESETGFLQACSNNPELRALGGGDDIEITPGKRLGSCMW